MAKMFLRVSSTNYLRRTSQAWRDSFRPRLLIKRLRLWKIQAVWSSTWQ